MSVTKTHSKSDKFLTLDAKDFMSEGEIDFEKQNLNILQESIENEISEYAVDFKEDLLDEGEKGFVRVTVLSRGMQEVFVCFDAKGQMRGYSKKISRDLISRICNSMNHTVREGTSKRKNELGT